LTPPVYAADCNPVTVWVYRPEFAVVHTGCVFEMSVRCCPFSIEDWF